MDSTDGGCGQDVSSRLLDYLENFYIEKRVKHKHTSTVSLIVVAGSGIFVQYHEGGPGMVRF